MARGWQWIDEDAEMTDAEIDRVTPLLDRLAVEWSNLHHAEEQRGFCRQADIEDGRDDRDFDSDEEMESAQLMDREMETLRMDRHESQLGAIEAAMARHGARMMRAYEHWNEDERYMQYMECDRFGDSY